MSSMCENMRDECFCTINKSSWLMLSDTFGRAFSRSNFIKSDKATINIGKNKEFLNDYDLDYFCE
jgi:hypothetical protein